MGGVVIAGARRRHSAGFPGHSGLDPEPVEPIPSTHPGLLVLMSLVLSSGVTSWTCTVLREFKARNLVNKLCCISSLCCVMCLVTQLCPTLCNHMDCSPLDSSVHRDSSSKNTGVSCLTLQRIFHNPGTEPRSPSSQEDFFLSPEPPRKPRNTGVGSLSLLQGIFLTQESNWGLLHCRRILYQLRYQGSPYFFTATATAKSLQSCPTLCDPIDGSSPGSSVPGILQARTLEWVAISFSNA